MPHKFRISNKVNLVSVAGLVPPKRHPQAHVFRWTTDGKQRPDYFRWSWHPPSGDLVVAVKGHHEDQIPKDTAKPFQSWLRGFVFCAERQIAARSYFWPLHPDDEWTAEDTELDRRIFEAFTALVRPQVRGYTFRHPIDNEWLRQTYAKYAIRW